MRPRDSTLLLTRSGGRGSRCGRLRDRVEGLGGQAGSFGAAEADDVLRQADCVDRDPEHVEPAGGPEDERPEDGDESRTEQRCDAGERADQPPPQQDRVGADDVAVLRQDRHRTTLHVQLRGAPRGELPRGPHLPTVDRGRGVRRPPRRDAREGEQSDAERQQHHRDHAADRGGPVQSTRASRTAMPTSATTAAKPDHQAARRTRAGCKTSVTCRRKTCQPSVNTASVLPGRGSLLPLRAPGRPRGGKGGGTGGSASASTRSCSWRPRVRSPPIPVADPVMPRKEPEPRQPGQAGTSRDRGDVDDHHGEKGGCAPGQDQEAAERRADEQVAGLRQAVEDGVAVLRADRGRVAAVVPGDRLLRALPDAGDRRDRPPLRPGRDAGGCEAPEARAGRTGRHERWTRPDAA